MDEFALLWLVSMYAGCGGGLRARSCETGRVVQDAATSREKMKCDRTLQIFYSQATEVWHHNRCASRCRRWVISLTTLPDSQQVMGQSEPLRPLRKHSFTEKVKHSLCGELIKCDRGLKCESQPATMPKNQKRSRNKKVDKILPVDAGALAYPCAADSRGRC